MNAPYSDIINISIRVRGIQAANVNLWFKFEIYYKFSFRSFFFPDFACSSSKTVKLQLELLL